MQRQHHTHADGLWLGGRSGLGCGRCSGSGRIGNEDIVALLQLIAWHGHVRIGLLEFVDGDVILLRNAIHGVFFLHLVHVPPLRHLSVEAHGNKGKQCAEQQSLYGLHQLIFLFDFANLHKNL